MWKPMQTFREFFYVAHGNFWLAHSRMLHRAQRKAGRVAKNPQRSPTKPYLLST